MTASTTGPTVLLLGCASTTPHGQDQFERVVGQALRRGVRLVGADTADNLRAASTNLLDEVVACDVHDPSQCASALAGRDDVDAVFTFREMCVESAAAVAQELGIAGNNRAAVRTVRTKDLCREALRAAGFIQPLCAVVADRVAAERFLADTAPGPWVVKPRDGMGSVGVSLVENPGQLAEAVNRLSPGVPFLVETFVVGQEFSAEGILLRGTPVVLALTAKTTGPGFVETGHRLPAALDVECANLASEEVVRALHTVGVTRGVFHVEFWVDDDGRVVLGELHARPGGDFIHAMLEHSRPGFELYGTLIDDLLGVPHSIIPPQTEAAGAQFLILPQGRVRSVRGWDDIAGDDCVIAADLSVLPGDRIGEVLGSADRHGVVVVGAPSAIQVEQALSRLIDHLHVEVG